MHGEAKNLVQRSVRVSCVRWLAPALPSLASRGHEPERDFAFRALTELMRDIFTELMMRDICGEKDERAGETYC
eukprot:440863-Pyramimonas_sp.AAC.1